MLPVQPNLRGSLKLGGMAGHLIRVPRQNLSFTCASSVGFRSKKALHSLRGYKRCNSSAPIDFRLHGSV